MYKIISRTMSIVALGLVSYLNSIFVTIVMVFIMLEIAVFYLISLWRVFKKAGKNGWEAFVPFYNNWVLVKISGLNWWYFLLNIITSKIFILIEIGALDIIGALYSIGALHTLGILCYFTNIVTAFFCSFNLAKKFHKNIGYAILLTLFPFVMMPILGFSSSCQYDSSVPVSPNGPIKKGLKQVNANNQAVTSNQTDSKFCTNCGTKVSNSEKFCANCGKKLNSELKHF